jgi:hypothetical protein
MRQRIRSHLTFANIVSLAALFVAMGGTATAVTYVVSSNSQAGPNTISGHKPPTGDHANIIAGSVNATDLAGSAVTNPKLANGAVSSAKVADNTLTGADVNESTLDFSPYMRLPVNSSGRPSDTDCFDPSTQGLAVYDSYDNVLYVCDGYAGWRPH